MDRFSVMNSYVAVCRSDSFTAAARTLGVSSSLVSRHIAHIEQELGVRLINRTARALSLTEQGRTYLAFCERILGDIAEGEATLKGIRDRPEGNLAIVSPKWIGSLDLSDAVAAFAAEHPLINVRFDVGGMSDRTYDFIEQGYDLAFHTKDLRDSSVRVRRVATLPFLLCASPEYLRRHPAPGTPTDLAEHLCLVHRNDPIWHLSADDAPVHHKVQHAAFVSNTYLVLQKAALEGLGIALLPLRPIFDDVRAGRLVPVLPEYEAPSRPLYVVYPPGLQSVQKLRVFLDYISDWFKRFPIDDVPLMAADGAHAPAAT